MDNSQVRDRRWWPKKKLRPSPNQGHCMLGMEADLPPQYAYYSSHGLAAAVSPNFGYFFLSGENSIGWKPPMVCSDQAA